MFRSICCKWRNMAVRARPGSLARTASRMVRCPASERLGRPGACSDRSRVSRRASTSDSLSLSSRWFFVEWARSEWKALSDSTPVCPPATCCACCARTASIRRISASVARHAASAAIWGSMTFRASNAFRRASFFGRVSAGHALSATSMFDATNVPSPERISTRPMDSRVRMPSRTEGRLTRNCTERRRSEGRRSPGRSRPSTTCRRICAAMSSWILLRLTLRRAIGQFPRTPSTSSVKRSGGLTMEG